MGHLTGKVLLLTGGGRVVRDDGKPGSIGYGIATAFAKEGANIVLTGRDMQKLQDAKEELERLYGVKVLPVQANIAEDQDNEKVVQGVIDTIMNTEGFGRIDVLINNAQASKSGKLLTEHSLSDFNLAMYSGVYATFHYMKAAYPALVESVKQGGGTVINFASGAGLFGNSRQSSYAAAKEAIRGLSRVAATEWAESGVTVNVVCPLAWTDQLDRWSKLNPVAFEKNVHTPPMGFFGDPEDHIGRVCVQLAHPDFKYMTGETITLEGGLGLRP